MELETLIAEERPLVKKLSRGFARRREALMSPEDLEQEGYLFLCRFYERVQKKHLNLGTEALKAFSYQSLKNFYISLYRKFSRKKRTAEIVSLDFPIPTSADPFKTLIFQEHLENLRGKFGGLEKEVFEILVGRNGDFLKGVGNFWRGNGYSSIKVRQVEIAGWLGVPQGQVGTIISVIKEKVAREFHWKSVYKIGRAVKILQVVLPEEFLNMDSLKEERELLKRFAAEMAMCLDPAMSIEEQIARVLDYGRMATVSFLSEDFRRFLKYNEGGQRELETTLSRSPKTKEINMFGVPDEEDCYGKMYDEAAKECQTCEQWKECSEVKKEAETMSGKKKKKEKEKKRQFAAQTSEKKEEKRKQQYTKKMKYDILRACGFEPKAAEYFLSLKCPDEVFQEVTGRTLEKQQGEMLTEKEMLRLQQAMKKQKDKGRIQPATKKEDVAQPEKRVDRKVVNPFKAGSGAAYAFDLVVEGGTRNDLVEKLGRIVKKEGLKIDPKKRMIRILKALQIQKEEKFKPYELLMEGEGGWKTFKVVKKGQISG